MKKLIAALLFAVAIPSHAQISGQVVSNVPGVVGASSILPTAPPQNRPDGTTGVQIADREGNTKAVLGHAEYTESARRGTLFSTINAGYTIVAANATKGAIATFSPIVGFINPLGSGVNAVIVNHREWHTSGTPGGPLIFNFYCGQNWVPAALGNAGYTLYNNKLSNNTLNTAPGSAMIVQSGAVPTTTPAITSNMLPFLPAGGPAAVAIATSDAEAGHYEDDKGQIVVPPGCLFGLASTATGTADVVTASLTWEEVAQ